MTPTIQLGTKLSVPAAEYATQVTAAIGMRGAGKSNVITVGVEGLLTHRIQVVILDPVGIHFGVRLDDGGKRPSKFHIPVLGGLHGDIPLLAQGGGLVAESLAASGSPAVLDVSGFSKGERIRFAADFLETFFDAKKRNPAPVQLVLEEAQRFAPQMIRMKGTGLERCLGAVEEIAEIGRNYGIGLAMMSQRPQKINKDVLNLTEFLLAFQLAGVHERKAIAEWVQEKGVKGRDEVSGELPSLKRGTALVWSPAWLGIYGKYNLHKKITYDAGATPLHARKSVKTKPLDLSSLEESVAEVVNESKKNDPKALRQRIAELERELTKKTPAARIETKTIEVQVSPISADKFNDLYKRLDEASELVKEISHEITRSEKRKPLVLKTVEAAPPSIRRPTAPRAPADANLPNGALRMLQALAATHARGLTRRQLGTLAKVKSSGGTFATYLSKLKMADYVSLDGEFVCVTATGRGAAGDVDAAPSTQAELLEQWRSKLGARPFEMLQIILNTGSIDKTTLGSAVGISCIGGTFSTYISKLRANGLIDGSGTYKPSSVWAGLS